MFGCLCYPLLRPYGLHKLEYRSKPCIFLRYKYAGYKCLDPVITNKVYLSRHAIFNEDFFPAKDQTTSQLSCRISAQGDAPFILPVPIPITNAPNTQPVSSLPTTPSPSAPSAASHDLVTTLDLTPTPATAVTAPNVLSEPSALELSPSPLHTTVSSHTLGHQPQDFVPSSNHPMVTRSRTGSFKPKSFADYQLHHTTHSEKEPVSYSKAAFDP